MPYRSRRRYEYIQWVSLFFYFPQTSRSPAPGIDAYLSLSAASKAQQTDAGRGGKFQIAAATERSPIDVVFAHAPVITVKLHETCESIFGLATRLNSTDVSVDKDAEDPAGEESKRSVNVERIGRCVWWPVGPRQGRGTV